MKLNVTFQDVLLAAKRLNGGIIETPLVYSNILSKEVEVRCMVQIGEFAKNRFVQESVEHHQQR